jgi:hypothetical protein
MDKVIPNRSLRLDEQPIAPWNSAGYEDCYEDLDKAAKKYGLRFDVPIDAVVGDVELTADEPLGERRLPVERLFEGRVPGQPLARQPRPAASSAACISFISRPRSSR